MHEFYEDLQELCETVKREIGEANDKIRAAGGKLSAGDLEYIYKLAHTAESIKTIMAMDEAEMGNSGDDMEGRGMMSGRSPYMGRSGNSYARRSARRDRMGRYSRDDGMMEQLHDLMESAPDERTKQRFRRFISEMEN